MSIIPTSKCRLWGVYEHHPNFQMSLMRSLWASSSSFQMSVMCSLYEHHPASKMSVLCSLYEHYEHYTLVVCVCCYEDSFSLKLMIFNDEWARPSWRPRTLLNASKHGSNWSRVLWLTNVYLVRTCDKLFNCLCSICLCVCVCVCTCSVLKSFHGILQCPASSALSLEHEIIAFMLIGLPYCPGKARILCLNSL
jgi:hypothetical protein